MKAFAWNLLKHRVIPAACLVLALSAAACAESSKAPAPQPTATRSQKPVQQLEAQTVSYQLSIEGMTCGQCAARVKGILEQQSGVASAEVDLERGSAMVKVKPGATLDESAVKDALDKDAYSLTACTISG